MKRKDILRLVFGILTGVIALIASLYVAIILKDADRIVPLFIVCAVGAAYSQHRWTDVYLEKHPEESWRKFPCLLKGEYSLNICCLNMYKWVLIIIVLMLLVIKNLP